MQLCSETVNLESSLTQTTTGETLLWPCSSRILVGSKWQCEVIEKGSRMIDEVNELLTSLSSKASNQLTLTIQLNMFKKIKTTAKVD